MSIEIEFDLNYNTTEIAREWTELESLVKPSFFLSWAWIGSWHSHESKKPAVVRVRQGSRTIALAFLQNHVSRRHMMSVRQLCLNETGEKSRDRLMIEHNNFLMAGDDQRNILPVIFRALQSTSALGEWDELLLGGVSQEVAQAATIAGLSVQVDRMSPDYCVNLLEAREEGGSWTDKLSPNLRAQIRQSRKFYEETGALELRAARSAVEAVEFFEQLIKLHDTYWRSKGRSGAFDSQYARNFHRDLISAHSQTGNVELLRLSAGAQVLGYLYNFQLSGTVSNYQSGFVYGSSNRQRPGLIAHALAIDRAMARGWDTYDFLAGDSAYKARLAEDKGKLIWCRAQRRRPGLIIERAARFAKRSLTRR